MPTNETEPPAANNKLQGICPQTNLFFHKIAKIKCLGRHRQASIVISYKWQLPLTRNTLLLISKTPEDSHERSYVKIMIDRTTALPRKGLIYCMNINRNLRKIK